MHRTVPIGGHILSETAGMFGPITIQDLAGKRWFYNAGRLQSAVFLSPTTSQMDSTRPPIKGPGPIGACTYTAGWLIAALSHPKGRGLMLGLGGAEGAISLLSNFPELTLDVIEIDNDLIEVVGRHYPLYRHYENLGRLSVFCACADTWLQQTSNQYDFVIFDIDDGRAEINPLLTNPRFLKNLFHSANEHWFNLITRLDHSNYSVALKTLAAAHWPHLFQYNCQPHSMNMLVTNRPPRSADASFKPFAQISACPGSEEQAAVDHVRARFAHLCRTVQDAGAKP
ncbi:hypothetical protein GCM10017044_15630 [Kordiimonas sediminis]|uniref:Spermidine synthase n=1 Tax=Kordiimonas sediminis TaxID=1735581 RepID=A0A919ASB7_9PROT|nr:hypothetical protein [Kordiimonas sediminis]GHF22352.1 hypothetical protein GCM10017044_15630 [Kordiimonas sediminis]